MLVAIFIITCANLIVFALLWGATKDQLAKTSIQLKILNEKLNSLEKFPNSESTNFETISKDEKPLADKDLPGSSPVPIPFH